MKRNSIYLSCVIIFFSGIGILANDTTDNEISIEEFFVSNGVERLSGRGVYIHTVYREALDVAKLLENKTFEDDQKKQLYLMRIQATTNANLSSNQNSLTNTLEKLYFENNKDRMEYSVLSPAMVNQLIDNPSLVDSIPLNLRVCDGEKTISLENVRNRDI
ncbi:MAG: hypothetical protein KAS32_00830 [Candidatus Peribacteraceae bacterium]|nr:hypothetical protein [Candidatus Peribacteraceae bacterium]